VSGLRRGKLERSRFAAAARGPLAVFALGTSPPVPTAVEIDELMHFPLGTTSRSRRTPGALDGGEAGLDGGPSADQHFPVC
jgi:hypothetical protein